ncbi:Fis family transcriptional regulator [Flexivirga endophytica]|uniref:Fis family transcriptional regulator n=1 Tax=Flexivirga endophytica TaxID=1849103 RepID=A0A916WWD2_9MICO|nr:DNA-binding protein [Flexivirga endophytica]GGB35053.1 Fis family transcriptional regulator [Flexivirga endophytica]GHB42891.1 Fis family transcriptional regulator [Flexivirga endophytica]
MTITYQRDRLAPRMGAREEVYGAWERFVKGENDIRGIRPEIAISWQRSRDQYGVDPFLPEAPTAVSQVVHSFDQDVAFTELGFRAAAMAHEISKVGGIVVVADAGGRVLAAWGDKETRAVATEGGLAPWYCWSEGAMGTNGMGTALAARHAVMIRQSEHWCQSFHDWSCGGVAIRDVVTKEPIAVLNISCWRHELPHTARAWLDKVAAHTQHSLRGRAHNSGAQLLAAYTNARGRTKEPLVAVDTAGAVVIADDAASVILGVPANMPATDAAVRWTPQLPSFLHAARYATKQAESAPDWSGTTHIQTTLSDERSSIGIEPVFAHGSLIGHLIAFGAFAGEQFQQQAEEGGVLRSEARRVVALREENRMVLFAASEVSVAVADSTGVWLVSDDGRLRSAQSTLDGLENDLSDTGSFLRVHRQYLVNLSRVREVERGEKGELIVVMSDPDRTVVPVSRRNARAVRRALRI